MRLKLSLLFGALLAGCAHEGVVVQKDTSPSPFYHSLGIDGSYAFLLRDKTGVVRRQLVTPEVFADYRIGDYFNDPQPVSIRDGKSSDGKTVMTAARKSPTLSRTASARKTTKSRPLASKVREPKKNVARRMATSARTKKDVRIAQVHRIAKPAAAARVSRPAQPEFVFVNIVRCR